MKYLLLALAFLFMALPAQAEIRDFDYSAFKQIVILHDGRHQPLESFARATLQKFSGKEKTEDISAAEWLALSFFDPKESVGLPVFKIDNPEVKHLFGLPEAGSFFALPALQPGFAKNRAQIKALTETDPSTLGPAEQELLALYENILRYNDILQRKNLPGAQALRTAWRGHDPAKWAAASVKARDLSLKEAQVTLPLVQLENIYVSIKPLSIALTLYIAGLACALIAARRKKPLPAALSLLYAAIAIHAAAIVARIMVLGRPPVGTLYESVLFVSLVCAGTGMAIYIARRNLAALGAGAAACAALLTLSPLLLRDQPDMEMLRAVLNTNFWLGTHVLCITAGYGVSILTACLAHLWLAARAHGASIEKRIMLQAAIYKLSLAALLLTAVGTVLGGIWADQSWGRFWGWDPKENGALLIVLWLVWIQHGRVAGKLSTIAFMAAAAFLNIIVALAWFGVNLLGTGLHSYGFTTGLTAGLGIFCAAETLLIAFLWFINRQKDNVHAL